MSQKTGCLGFFFGNKDRVSGAILPYRKRQHFLSPAECSFYKALSEAVGDAFAICPKVGLRDLFQVEKPDQVERYDHCIDQKHVDFLLCDLNTLLPVLGVELDDLSQQFKKNKEEAIFIDEIFDTAKLPLARVFVSRSYEPENLRDYLFEAVGVAEKTYHSSDRIVPEAAPEHLRDRETAELQPGVITTARDLVEEKFSKEEAAATFSGVTVPECADFEITVPPLGDQAFPERVTVDAVSSEIASFSEESPLTDAALSGESVERPLAPGDDRLPEPEINGARVEFTPSPSWDQKLIDQPAGAAGMFPHAAGNGFSLEQFKTQFLQEAAAKAAGGDAPLCSNCQVPMLLRTSKRGIQFYCCPHFPRCREVRGLYE
ncbi:MAG: DUF2726 domain-containing protein [Bacillota bacterium]